MSQQLTIVVNGSGTMPITHSFTASPLTVAPGQAATLSWQTSNATLVDIDNNAGTQFAAMGTVQVIPTETTVYTLTAKGDADTVTAQVTVTVQSMGPVIVSLSAQPSSVTAGDSATITWTTTNATEVNFDQGIGRKATSGSVVVTPQQSTLYTMTAIGPGGQATRTVQIDVSAMGAPSITRFTVSASTINAGDSTTLSWQTSDADTVSIDNSVGSQATSGQVSVTPSMTTSYTLEALNMAGSTTARVTVTVNPGGPTN